MVKYRKMVKHFSGNFFVSNVTSSISKTKPELNHLINYKRTVELKPVKDTDLP